MTRPIISIGLLISELFGIYLAILIFTSLFFYVLYASLYITIRKANERKQPRSKQPKKNNKEEQEENRIKAYTDFTEFKERDITNPTTQENNIK
jgi:hypothetical protein